MKRHWGCYAASVALAGFVAAGVPSAAIAKDAHCVSSEESAALRLRDLQSRLMVAALSCNQQTAYNTFIERFRPSLTLASQEIIGYFKRTGGGEPALNSHLTQLANAAGLSRAEEPEEFCGDTWAMFLLLEEEPEGLPVMAAKYRSSVALPAQCGASEDAAPAIVAPTGPTAPMVKASAGN